MQDNRQLVEAQERQIKGMPIPMPDLAKVAGIGYEGDMS